MTTTAGTAPRDFADLKFMLMQRRDSFPKRLKQLADFAMRRPDEIALGNLVSIGQMAGVPASTLVRFAKSLGFDGFPELQALFRDQLRDRLPDYDERLRRLREREESRQGTLGLLDDLCEVAAASMAHLQATAEEADFERALARLADAQTIFVLGQRRAFPIASFMAYMLARLRLRSVLVDNVGSFGTETMSFATPRDVLVAVSFTPYTPLTVELAAAAAERGIPIVAVTDSLFSPLASLTDTRFEIVEKDFQGFRSSAATMSLVATLAIAAAERKQGRHGSGDA